MVSGDRLFNNFYVEGIFCVRRGLLSTSVRFNTGVVKRAIVRTAGVDDTVASRGPRGRGRLMGLVFTEYRLLGSRVLSVYGDRIGFRRGGTLVATRRATTESCFGDVLTRVDWGVLWWLLFFCIIFSVVLLGRQGRCVCRLFA